MRPGRKAHIRTPTQVALLRRYWLEGVPVCVIATRLGVSRSAVSNAVKRLGLPPRPPRPPRRHGPMWKQWGKPGAPPAIRDPQDVADFTAAWNAGVRVVDMAAQFGVSVSAVSSTAIRLGLPERPWSHKKRKPRAAPPPPEPDELDEPEPGEWRVVRGVRRWIPATQQQRPRRTA